MSSSPSAVNVDSDAVATYVRSTPKSRALHDRALHVMPDGTTRTVLFFEPYPLYIREGTGCRVTDVDGTERLDMIGNYTSLVHGHRHPAIMEALTAQLGRGTAFGAANALEIELAEELCRRVPSLEQVRFTNSGTEATMYAMRVAKAFTQRPKMARIEGGYHGTHEYAQVSNGPDMELAGPADQPVAVPEQAISPAVAAETVVLPYNNLEAAERILTAHAEEVAAVIVEPAMSNAGMIAATREYLQTLRDLTRRFDMLLIFDEVVTLRVAAGGAQELIGVTPDLTTMGKIIGGGLPVGGFGGRADIMSVLDQRRSGSLPGSGTFNGNPMTMAAGLASIQALTPNVIGDLNRRGEWVRRRLADVFESHDVPVQVTGLGSLFGIHFTDAAVTDYRAFTKVDRRLNRELFFRLLNGGVLFAPRSIGALSTPMGDTDVQEFIDAVDRALMQPLA